MRAARAVRRIWSPHAAAILLWVLTPFALFAGARPEPDQRALTVFVSIPPQAYFAERIAGDRAEVHVLVSPGLSPHTFEPTPRQMAVLARADIFFRVGVEFENALLPRIEGTTESLQIVDCLAGIRRRAMDSGDDEGLDPHVWLSVRNAIQISQTIHAALVRLDPDERIGYDRRLSALVDDLDDLDERIREILKPVEGKEIFVFHPSFGYFADDYGLTQVAVETGGSEPSARELAKLIDRATEKGVRVIFVQPQFSQRTADTIATQIGGAVVAIDPLARDYVDSLERMARAVEEALRRTR